MDSVQPADKRVETLRLTEDIIRWATSRAELHLLPVACAEIIGYRFSRDEPRQALMELDIIFRGGEEKHGVMDWKQHNAYEFLAKAERHLLKSLLGKHFDDESGRPHIVHGAADLLIAAELLIPWWRNKHGLPKPPTSSSDILPTIQRA